MYFFEVNEPRANFRVGAIASIPESDGLVHVYLTPDTFDSRDAVRAPADATVHANGDVALSVRLDEDVPLGELADPGSPGAVEEVCRQGGQWRLRLTDRVTSVTFE